MQIVQELSVCSLVVVVEVGRISRVRPTKAIIQLYVRFLAFALQLPLLIFVHETAVAVIVPKVTERVHGVRAGIVKFIFIVAGVLFRLTLNQLAHFLLHLLREGVFLDGALNTLLELDLLVLLLFVLEVVVVLHVQPGVFQHLLRSRSPVVMPLKHGQQEVRECLRLVLLNQIFVSEHLLDRPVAEPLDAPQITLAVEVLARVFAREGQVLRHATQKLHHLGDVIVIFVVVLPFARLKQKVSSYHFKNSARKRPDICRGIIIGTNDNFRGTILARLDFWSEVVVVPAAISHVTNLDLHIIANLRSSLCLLGLF